MTTEPTTAVVRTNPQIFTDMVMREFSGATGASLEMTPYQKTLAQHLFIKIDAKLNEYEQKRLAKTPKDTGKPISWANCNMNKLAIDSVHRVNLGLDALIDNHISPIPYFNTKLQVYDLDLRIGYVGKDYYRRQFAVEPPLNIIYELVYSTDKFTAKKRSLGNIETYEFEMTQPFDRGTVVGGFGYIVFEDHWKNELVIVPEASFLDSKSRAKTKDFWDRDPIAMRYKTLVLRVTEKLPVDPRKINASYTAVESEDIEGQLTEEINENANQEFIDVEVTELRTAIATGRIEPTISEISRAECTNKESGPEPVECPKCGVKYDVASEEAEHLNNNGICDNCARVKSSEAPF